MIENLFLKIANSKQRLQKSTTIKIKMETPKEKRQRMISLYIVHTSMFVFALGNSVIMMGVWPYLQAVREILDLFIMNLVLEILCYSMSLHFAYFV